MVTYYTVHKSKSWPWVANRFLYSYADFKFAGDDYGDGLKTTVPATTPGLI